MRNLFRFIHRNHLIFLFIFLEILSFIFIFNFNNYQKVRFLNSSSSLTAGVYERYSKVTDFFGLPSVNRELAEENARLRGILGIESPSRRIPESMLIRYSGMDQQYGFIPARIINITVNRQQNYFTINKGSKDGVKPDMGVITIDGVAGVITNVTANYATGLTILNTRWNVSAMLKKNNYFGTLAWDGKNYQKAMLNEIPFHVNVAVGDTIITSGYSSLFPTGIMLGTVESFNKGGGENFYTIRVNLSVDFKSLSYVEVIQNNKRTEIENIQKLIGTDENLD